MSCDIEEVYVPRPHVFCVGMGWNRPCTYWVTALMLLPSGESLPRRRGGVTSLALPWDEDMMEIANSSDPAIGVMKDQKEGQSAYRKEIIPIYQPKKKGIGNAPVSS
ncbi:serine/threonine-protein kinase AFC3-like protein [Corchorus olitorius]|uniref:Serine/threonine-protein kinase AFC3-like protein n=1 Tax=Corchorus olitorius TaxID=93759 RepID=A0A1R3KZH9_9ROSI|nr:serine/threonine-protein kinase AFC3-like protein [Corchorus olitorius]